MSQKTDEHVVKVIIATLPCRGLFKFAWGCTCGDTEVFRGIDGAQKAWCTARRHAEIWGGRLA